MLLLTRKVNESIMIGDDIEVRLAFLDSTQALIGIEAPRDLAIHRKEVYVKCMDMMKKS